MLRLAPEDLPAQSLLKSAAPRRRPPRIPICKLLPRNASVPARPRKTLPKSWKPLRRDVSSRSPMKIWMKTRTLNSRSNARWPKRRKSFCSPTQRNWILRLNSTSVCVELLSTPTWAQSRLKWIVRLLRRTTPIHFNARKWSWSCTRNAPHIWDWTFLHTCASLFFDVDHAAIGVSLCIDGHIIEGEWSVAQNKPDGGKSWKIQKYRLICGDWLALVEFTLLPSGAFFNLFLPLWM